MSQFIKKTSNTSNKPSQATLELSKRELEFLLIKLRTATYSGEEFEMFYTIWTKVASKVEQINK